MQSAIHYNQCPVCQSTRIHAVLTVKDYTVSQTAFEVWECDECTLRFTQDVPAPGDIGQYYQSADYISHTNTRKGLVNRLYHLVRQRALRQKKELVKIATGRSTGRLLDVGAGIGAFASYMRDHQWQVTGLEPDAGTRKRAAAEFGIQLESSDRLFELEPGQFDAITLWHVLEHVHALAAYMEQLKKLLKPGGKLFIAVPNYTSGDAAFYGAYWAAYDVPRHLYHFSPAAMRRLLARHNLELLAVRPMWFDSFYVSLLSEKYKTGKTGLLRGAWNGWKSNRMAARDKEKCSSLIYVME